MSAESFPAKTPNAIFTVVDDDVRGVMRWNLARFLGVEPAVLPPMSDEQLWEAYKKVARQISNPWDAVPEEILSRLCIGDELALALGSACDASHYPAGEYMGEIWKAATGLGLVEWAEAFVRRSSSKD